MTHQWRPESFEKEIGYRLGSSEYTSPEGFDGSHVVLNKSRDNKL